MATYKNIGTIEESLIGWGGGSCIYDEDILALISYAPQQDRLHEL